MYFLRKSNFHLPNDLFSPIFPPKKSIFHTKNLPQNTDFPPLLHFFKLSRWLYRMSPPVGHLQIFQLLIVHGASAHSPIFSCSSPPFSPRTRSEAPSDPDVRARSNGSTLLIYGIGAAGLTATFFSAPQPARTPTPSSPSGSEPPASTMTSSSPPLPYFLPRVLLRPYPHERRRLHPCECRHPPQGNNL